MKNTVLIPTDFTEVAECAIEHGINIAKTLGSEISVLHVVEKQKEVANAQKRVDEIAVGVKDKSGIDANGVVRVGNIFDDIGNAASEERAGIIVMGTHGVKGIQHLVGSYALKVITNSAVPFIVVQKRRIREGYKNIVLPLDLSKETKQKLVLASEIAKHFSSKIHLITPKETDEFLKNQLNRNIAYAKKFLKDANISFSTTIAEGKGSFDKEVVKFAASVDADLISIMNIQNANLSSVLGGPYEQKIITNDAQIPVMCVNPKKTTTGGSVFS